MGLSRLLFVYFRPFYIIIQLQIHKSTDAELGIGTRGHRIVKRRDPLSNGGRQICVWVQVVSMNERENGRRGFRAFVFSKINRGMI